MNQSYEQYDVIIIGSGKSGQAAINSMKEQGIKALLIELEPHTVATMVNQSLIKPQPSSPIYHTTENQDASLTHHIAVHKQVMSTTINQTVTYTLYASAVPDNDPVIVEAEQTNKDSSYMSQSYTSHDHNDNDMIVDAEFVEFSPSPSTNDNYDDDLEVVEPEWVENQDDHDAFSAKFNHFSNHRKRYASHQKMWAQKETLDADENADHDESLFNKSDQDFSLRSKLHRRKTFSQANQTDENESPVEFDSFSYKATEQQSNWIQSSTPIAPNKEAQQEAEEANKQSFLHTLLDQPLHLERESRLRKRFINKQRIENQQKHVLPSPDKEMHNEGFYQSPLSKRKIVGKQNHSNEIHEDLTGENTQSDLLQTDSNLTRKRTRAQKKKRMFGKQDHLLFETRIKKTRQKSIQTDTESEPETVYHFDSSPTPPFKPPMKENHFTFESENVEESPSMEEHHVDTSSSTTSQANQQSGGDALKRDTIEFEEPYDGYSSWEDFVTPYSSNNRKRQEMDQVEKRKIALRGLHNLINNLG